MIDLSKSEQKRRGRPPKKAEEAVKAEAPMQQASSKKNGDGPFKFKSKYREDIVWLKTPRRELRPDGSVFIDPGVKAEFHRNDWVTEDKLHAKMMRGHIEDAAKAGRPMHIVEITDSI